MPATFWDNFDHLIVEAETTFLNGDINVAVEKWRAYYKITALSEWENIADEIENVWTNGKVDNISSLDGLFEFWKIIRDYKSNNKMTQYSFNLFNKLIGKTYLEKYRSDENGANGVFEYICGNYHEAITLLKKDLQDDNTNMIARIYTGWSYIKLKEHKTAISILTKNLFLSADLLTEDDLYLSQFKMLYGKLHSLHSNHKEAVWLLTFESWYRNWLFFEEDDSFYQLMRQKEIDERIFQVKYYLHERYRHFARCLYIAEYNHQFNKKNIRPILEQENYMQRLDPQLFDKYRKKRKALIQS